MSAEREDLIVLLDVGQKLLRIAKYQEAQTKFERMLEVLPTNFEANLGLGISYAGQNKLAMATEFFKSTIRLKPQSSIPYFQLAMICTRMGKDSTIDKKSAKDYFKLAGNIKLDEYDEMLHSSLSKAYIGQFEEAIKIINQAIRSLPIKSDGYCARGKIYYMHEKFEEAKSSFELALERDKNSDYLDAYVGMADTCKKLELLKDADQFYKQATMINSDCVRALVGRASVLPLPERNEEGLGKDLEYVETLLERDDKQVEVLLSKARIFVALKREYGAREVYDSVLALDDTNLEALLALGGYYLDSGFSNSTKAVEYFDRILAFNASNVYALRGKLFAYLGLGMYEEYLALRSRGINEDELINELFFLDSVVFCKLSKLDSALVSINKALKIDSNDTNNIILKAQILYERNRPGDMQEAKVVFEGALELDSDSVDGILGLASISNFLENYDQALEQYERVVVLDSKHALAYRKMALIHKNKGDTKQFLKCNKQAYLTYDDYCSEYKNAPIFQDIAAYGKIEEVECSYYVGLALENHGIYTGRETNIHKMLRIEMVACLSRDESLLKAFVLEGVQVLLERNGDVDIPVDKTCPNLEIEAMRFRAGRNQLKEKTCTILRVDKIEYENPLLNNPALLDLFTSEYGTAKTSVLLDLTSELSKIDSSLVEDICHSASAVESLATLIGEAT